MKIKELFELFFIFCRIGGFTFGGGYAMLPIIQEEIVEKRNWSTDEEIIDYYAIGQCTPGIIAINTATFIGYSKKGINKINAQKYVKIIDRVQIAKDIYVVILKMYDKIFDYLEYLKGIKLL